MEKKELKIGVNAEWELPTEIIVCEPSIEMFYGSLKPSGVLYEGPLNFSKAKLEHQIFVRKLKNKTGANIYDIKDLMIKKTVDERGNLIEGERLEKLRYLAKNSLLYNYENLDLQEIKKSEIEKELVITQKTPEDLVNIILSQFKINSYKSFDGHASTQNKIEMNPLYNLMFMRDQMITTPNGIILGKMNSRERQSETELVRLGLEGLGIKPIGEINGSGKLEGGDYLPAGEIGFLGIGCRTNFNAIEQLLKKQNEYFGNQILAIVVDSNSDQEHMHLDTYMNILDNKKILIAESRYSNSKNNQPMVELFKNGKSLKHKNGEDKITLKEYLVSNNYQVGIITEDMQKAYGINFLNIGSNKFIGSNIENKDYFYNNLNNLENKIRRNHFMPEIEKNQTSYSNLFKEYTKILSNININIDDLDFINMNHFNRAYGGPHCGTQVISRDSNFKKPIIECYKRKKRLEKDCQAALL